ncbi:hypothetical protein N8739_09100 [Luminiphilus sp.]|nr:hypothetical protein [Luminiphilus sp.]
MPTLIPICQGFGADTSAIDLVIVSTQAFEGLYQAWLDCGVGRVTVVFAPFC